MGAIIERAGNSILRTCPTCGKNFIPTYDWAYKKNSEYFCRYNCYKQAGGDNPKNYRTNVKRG